MKGCEGHPMGPFRECVGLLVLATQGTEAGLGRTAPRIAAGMLCPTPTRAVRPPSLVLQRT